MNQIGNETRPSNPRNYWDKYSDVDAFRVASFMEGSVVLYMERYYIEEELYVQSFGELKGLLKFDLYDKYPIHNQCEC